MKNKSILTVILLCVTVYLSAQEKEKSTLTISGYAEVYYQQDFNNPVDNKRPSFVYSHNRNNEFNINLAFIKAAYNTERLRTNIAMATGTYMNTNYSAETDVIKNIYEANVGFKLSKKHNLWIDAGLMPSHIGFERAIGRDNWTLTRSLFADNSPYFETGAKISYTSESTMWFISGMILNGWQRVQRVNGNSTPAFGHQIIFKPNAKWIFNSSSFIGNDKADSVRQMRYFHNLYAIYQMNDKIGLTTGFDIGAEQKSKGSSAYNTWFTPVLIAKYTANQKLALTGRAEYYQDKKGVIIATGTSNGFQAVGLSLNIDYNILPNLMWRTEIRNLNNGNDAIFIDRDNSLKRNSTTATSALAVSF
ncbi:porin [Sphingobacterium bovistauri]|uniref:Porin n=1 Tax=Sphingobacterium bovistauri TaxID=2781959 RepID=A0ABS7Z5X3_9SPHI|nr:porin [Sphingobacterium bovistauri]MCA5005554.1 porin [Sphingobacterium bovistauri]